MGHTGVSDIESREPGKPLKHANKKTVYVLLLEVACTLSNSLNVQQF